MNSGADCKEDTTLLYDTLPFVKSEYPKWFVYRDDNVFCLGNNYHSLLLFLKSKEDGRFSSQKQQ